jgi:hypothetical protein
MNIPQCEAEELVLKKAYELNKENPSARYPKLHPEYFHNMLNTNEILRTCETLENDGDLKLKVMMDCSCHVEITGQGIKRIEDDENPKDICQPYTQNIFITGRGNCQIQNSTVNSKQKISENNFPRDEVIEGLTNLEKKLQKIVFHDNKLQEIHDNLKQIRTEVSFAQPNTSIINKCFESIKNVLGTVVQNTFVCFCTQEINHMLTLFPH